MPRAHLILGIAVAAPAARRGPEADAALKRALADPEWNVQMAAAKVLGPREESAILDDLVAGLESDDHLLRRGCVLTLARNPRTGGLRWKPTPPNAAVVDRSRRHSVRRSCSSTTSHHRSRRRAVAVPFAASPTSGRRPPGGVVETRGNQGL